MGQKMSQLAKPEMPHLPWFTVDDGIGKLREVEKQECISHVFNHTKRVQRHTFHQYLEKQICDVNPG
jgi:hypothetical protein